MITKGYELAVHDIIAIGVRSQLNVGSSSVMKVDGKLLIKDDVNISIEAREIIIGPNITCIATDDTSIAENFHIYEDKNIDSILKGNFTGSPTVSPGLFCYSFYGTCEEWNALNELFFDPQTLSSKIPCLTDGENNMPIDSVWF